MADSTSNNCFNHIYVDYENIKVEKSKSSQYNEEDIKFDNEEQIKKSVRNTFWPVDHTVRRNLWKRLVDTYMKKEENLSGSNEKDIYYKDIDQIFGKNGQITNQLPEFIRQPGYSNLNYFYLNDNGKQAIKRILCVIEFKYPHITYSPGLLSISSLLLHYMEEYEVFSILCALLSTKEHIIETRKNWETTCLAFKKLIKVYFRSSYDSIVAHAKEPLESIFNCWYFWIFDSLPFYYLVKILDCFLLEGQKIFYRIGLIIAHHFSKTLKIEKKSVDMGSIPIFVKKHKSSHSVKQLLKESFLIRNLKRSNIKLLHVKEAEKKKLILDANNEADGKTMVSSAQNGKPNFSKIFLKESNTTVLTHSNLSVLWNWIPVRFSVYEPKSLFSTAENGTSMNTLLNVLDEVEYCLIVLKTFQNEIFGAFTSCVWNDRKEKKEKYFGNGESFLFTLNPANKIYRWVGTRKSETTVNQELFVRVTSEKIVIGGGGCEGLSIQSNLTSGSSNRCETFENESLVSSSEDHNNFEIETLEIISFENQ